MSTEHDWTALATYNAERSRGLVHTDEWRQRMAHEQTRFEWVKNQEIGAAVGPPPPPVLLVSAKDKLGPVRDGGIDFPNVDFPSFVMGGLVVLLLTATGLVLAYTLGWFQ